MYIQYRNERSYHALKPDTQAAQDRARHCSNRNRCSRRWCGGSCSRRAGAGEVPAAVALASAVQVAPALAWARVAAVAGSCSAGSSPKRPTLPARSLHRPSNRWVCPALGPSSRSFAWRSRRRRTCFCRIIVLNTKFLVFDTQFLVFNGK